jgi:hypothetical protein
MTEPAFIIKTNAAGVDVYHANPKYIPTDEDDMDNPREHWTGMPEFEQKSQKPFSMIKVRFENEEALNEFAELIGQKLTPKTKSIWHPKLVRGKDGDLCYVDTPPPYIDTPPPYNP